jgi:C4-dicarboxylate transporter, DctM subunit
MSSEMIGVIITILFFLLMFAGMPIAFALTFSGFLGLSFLLGIDAALHQLSLVPYSAVADYTFSVVPLFILTGGLAFQAGLVKDLYEAAHKWLGHLPGGLAITSIGACAGFAACTGSSMASAATMTQVAWPEMKKRNYKPSFALGTIAAGGTLGILIPPSIPFIIYGIITQQSVGKLFMSGVIPGILLTLLFMITIYSHAKIDPTIAPAAPRASWSDRLSSLRYVIPGGILAFIILGGIWGGIFTATEAGGAGAFAALVIALVKRSITWKGFIESLKDTVSTTAMIFAMLIGAMIFGYFLTASGVTTMVVQWVGGLKFSHLGILIIILLLYNVLGCLMDAAAITLITMPLIFPVIKAIGVDPILFGCLFVINMEMALITPPIAMNVFVISGMVKEVPMYTIFKGVYIYLAAMAVCTALVIIFPQLALFIPSHMGH